MARRTARYRRLKPDQREQFLLDLARLRYSAIMLMARLNPNSNDYGDLERLVAAIDQTAGVWTGRDDYFHAEAHKTQAGSL